MFLAALVTGEPVVRICEKGLLQNAAAQRREKNEKRKEMVFSYENDFKKVPKGHLK